MNKTIILDETAQGVASSFAKEINLSINLDQQIIQIDGKQVNVTVNNKEIASSVPNYYSHRGLEISGMPVMPNQNPEVAAKTAAKKVLADAFLEALENATETYMKGVFDLENPTPVVEEGEGE